MLEHHLSQEHDLASRRFEIIDRQVDWIHGHVLGGAPGRVLDLVCGPGLYSTRFTRLGHSCRGIDFSPASIEYAKKQALLDGLDIDYECQDIRTARYGEGYDLAAMIYGEFNVFKRSDIQLVLRKAHDALKGGGVFLAEPNRFEAVKAEGLSPSSWSSHSHGLFSDKPHLSLYENFWDEEKRVATNRYYIIDAATGEVTRHASSMIAYTRPDYRQLLEDAGFRDIEFHESLTGSPEDSTKRLEVIIGRA